MPFIPSTGSVATGAGLSRSIPKETPALSAHDKPEPSFMDTISAAFERENLIGSALSSEAAFSSDTNRFDPEFDLFETLKEDGRDFDGLDESIQTRLLDVHNKAHLDAVFSDIDRERKNNDTLTRAGWTGVGLSIGAAIADPTILIPGGAFAKSGQVGFSAGKSLLRIGAAAAGATAVQEAGLQATQETRTGTESAINIGGSALLGGLIGFGGAKFFSKSEFNKLSQGIEREISEEVENPAEIAETIVGRLQSAGAASVDQIDISDLGVGGPRVAEAVANATSALQINPGIQTMLSPSKKVREVYNKAFDNPIYTKMNMDGQTLGPSAESMVKKYQRGSLSSWIRDRNKLFKESRKAGEGITRDEFNQRVGRAMRRGDEDIDSEFVTKAAQSARAKITDPLLKEAQSVRLLGEDVKTTTAQTYFTRQWNRKNLEANELRFKDITRNWLSEQIDNLPSESDLPDFVNVSDRQGYIDEIADSIFDKLTGRGFEDVPEWIVPTQRGPLKERTFKIPDELVEEFLDDDAELVLRRHVRTMAAEVELARKFEKPDMSFQIKEIRDEYKDLRAAVEGNKSIDAKQKQAELNSLKKSEKRDITNIEAFRDMLRGTYRMEEESSNWGKATRLALAWNYMRLLGGVTLTSLADTARLMGTHGMRSTMREGLPELVKNVRGVSLSINEAKELGAVTEVILNSRLASLAEIQDPYASGDRFERMMANATTTFSKLTGLGYWNDAMKGVVSTMTQNRIVRNSLVGDYSKLDRFEKSYMGFLGIDENMSARIARQYGKHGQKDGQAFVANTHLWDDKQAMQTYAAALNKDVDRSIVTKGIADQPLWTRSNWGKLIFQFKSFGLASHQRVLIAGLQERPHRMAEMLLFGTTIGMMIAYLKHLERGDVERANALLENPGLWITDGLDRTGILSIPFEVSNTAEKLGLPVGIKSAAQSIAGDENRGQDVSRFATRNKTGAVLGPSAGLFEDLTKIAEQVSKGDLKRSGANAIVRQIPGGSLPGIKTGLYVGARPALQELVE